MRPLAGAYPCNLDYTDRLPRASQTSIIAHDGRTFGSSDSALAKIGDISLSKFRNVSRRISISVAPPVHRAHRRRKNSHNGTLKHAFFELNWGGRVNAISAIIGKKMSFRCRWALVTLKSAGIDLQGPRESARLPRSRFSDCAGRRFCARKCIKPTPPCAKNGSGNEKLFSQS